MNNKGLIIFDFDGTLGDTRKTIVTTMQMTIRELQLPDRSEAACASTIGLPLAGCKSKAKAKAKRPLDESGLFLISINKVVNNFFSYSLSFLLIYKLNLPSIPTRSDGEVKPVVTCSAVVLDEQLIEILPPLAANLQEMERIPYRLLRT